MVCSQIITGGMRLGVLGGMCCAVCYVVISSSSSSSSSRVPGSGFENNTQVMSSLPWRPSDGNSSDNNLGSITSRTGLRGRLLQHQFSTHDTQHGERWGGRSVSWCCSTHDDLESGANFSLFCLLRARYIIILFVALLLLYYCCTTDDCYLIYNHVFSPGMMSLSSIMFIVWDSSRVVRRDNPP